MSSANDNLSLEAIKILSELIINSESAHSHLFKRKREMDFYFKGEPCVFVCASGRLSVYDEANDALLFTADAPFIIGLTQLFSSDTQQSIRFETDSQVYLIPTKAAVALFDDHAVWRHVAVLIEHVANTVFLRYTLSSSSNVYGIIKSHVEYLWKLPDYERSKISIIDFILKRNKISRSSVYRIIKDLNDGGYIKTVRGKLESVEKLPISY